MKYMSVIENILDREKWESTSQIKKEVEIKTGKSVNWYYIMLILERFEKEDKVKKVNSENTVLWRKK